MGRVDNEMMIVWIILDIDMEQELELLFLVTSLKTDLRMVLVWLLLDNTSNNILWDILLIPFLDVTRKSDLTQ